MRRIWGLAAFSCAWAAPGVLYAQTGEAEVSASSGEPDRGAPSPASLAIIYGAMPGGVHVASAETLPAGSAVVEGLSGFGYRKGLLGANERFVRGLGDISAAYGVIAPLTVGISLDGYYDRHWGLASGGNSGCGATCDDGYVGNPHLYARFATPLGKHRVGVQIGLWVPGNKPPSLMASAASVDVLALGSFSVGPGVLSVNAGFRVDNSAKSFSNIDDLSPQDQASLGVSNYNEVLTGAQLLIPSSKAWFGMEGSLEAFIGSPPSGMPDLKEGRLLVRAGLSGGIHVAAAWSVVGYVEAAKSPGVQAAQVSALAIPIVPYEPIVTAGVGLTARFGGPKGVGRTQVACWDTAEGCTPDERPIVGAVSGTVIDDTGKPLVGAKVTIKGHVYGDPMAPVVTDDKGGYRISDVKLGRRVTTPSKAGPQIDEKIDETSIDVTVELADRKPGTATIDSPKVGDNQVPAIRLEPLLPPGQLKGIVRSLTGRPIDRATISVSPGDRKTESGADGTFMIDLAPGKYRVTVKAPGMAAQELDVTIDPNGVALKEFVLHK
jgi:hypothetical protein